MGRSEIFIIGTICTLGVGTFGMIIHHEITKERLDTYLVGERGQETHGPYNIDGFAAGGDHYESDDSGALAVGDLDGDGDDDLLLAKSTSDFSGVKGYENNGAAKFTEKGYLIENDRVNNEDGIGLALGDMDQDGDLDILYAKATRHFSAIRFYENEGRWRFSYKGNIAELPRYENDDELAIRVSDIDSDGDLDVLVHKSLNDFSGIAKIINQYEQTGNVIADKTTPQHNDEHIY